jgi:hypothetical protein
MTSLPLWACDERPTAMHHGHRAVLAQLGDGGADRRAADLVDLAQFVLRWQAATAGEFTTRHHVRDVVGYLLVEQLGAIAVDPLSAGAPGHKSKVDVS